jgi:hypothetical protein
MIDYSPHTKYTAQKIQDKVTRGSYFYCKFIVQTELGKIDIEKIIHKLTERYSLNLTSRQRTYRLKQRLPVADLIVQDILYKDAWLFILLIKTPNSHRHSKETIGKVNSTTSSAYTSKDKIAELEPVIWDKITVEQELTFIRHYYKDNEQFNFILNKPYLCLDFGKCEAELVRLSHKKYAEHQTKFYRKSNKNFSWTWRFKKTEIEKQKRELTHILNRVISQKDQTKALNDLLAWQHYFKVYAVFRGNRQQAGRLYTFGKLFFFSRKRQRWDQVQMPVMDLTIIARYETYADSYTEYCMRRYFYESFEAELPREISKTEDWKLINAYIDAEYDQL